MSFRSPGVSMMNVAAVLPDVTKVKVLGHYRLRLTFADGLSGEADVSDLQGASGLLADLRDPDYFARVAVDRDSGTLAWPNGVDLAPDVLYEQVRDSNRSRRRRRLGWLLKGGLAGLGVIAGGRALGGPHRTRV